MKKLLFLFVFINTTFVTGFVPFVVVGEPREIGLSLKRIKFETQEEVLASNQVKKYADIFFKNFSWLNITKKNNEDLPFSYKCLKQNLEKVLSILELGESHTLTNLEVQDDPFELFWYIYNWDKHQGKIASPAYFNLNALYNDPLLLAQCITITVNELSPISAAIIAPKISTETKREIIGEMFNLGFKPTDSDIETAKLELYERNPLLTKQIATLLAGYYKGGEESPLASLPLEIFKYIIWLLMEEKPLLDYKNYEHLKAYRLN